MFTIGPIKSHFAGCTEWVFKEPIISNSAPRSPIKFPISTAAEPHARHSVSAMARISYSPCLNCCLHLLHRCGLGLPFIMFLEFPLPLGYSTSCLLDTGLLFTSEKIYLREERGLRFLLWNILTSHLSLLFSPWGISLWASKWAWFMPKAPG